MSIIRVNLFGKRRRIIAVFFENYDKKYHLPLLAEFEIHVQITAVRELKQTPDTRNLITQRQRRIDYNIIFLILVRPVDCFVVEN